MCTSGTSTHRKYTPKQTPRISVIKGKVDTHTHTHTYTHTHTHTPQKGKQAGEEKK
jgi:hypothetical protein